MAGIPASVNTRRFRRNVLSESDPLRWAPIRRIMPRSGNSWSKNKSCRFAAFHAPQGAIHQGVLQNAPVSSLRTREAGVAIRFLSKRGRIPTTSLRTGLGMTGFWHFATRPVFP
jgi:hypothetical protein